MKASVSAVVVSVALVAASAAAAQSLDRGDVNPNRYPNPYKKVTGFLKLPPGRVMGQTSAVAVDHEGHIWVADRCGGESCASSTLDPVMEFDATGRFIKAFGRGLFVYPQGLFIDTKDHLWIADGRAENGKGDDVMEFDRDGKLLRTLGTPGVMGRDDDTFETPCAVLVTPQGDIFVLDSQDQDGGNTRIMRFDPQGKLVLQWGELGNGLRDLYLPRALAIDREGRIYVGDRGNDRVEVFSQKGVLLDVWIQFSRPSALFIDENDVLYAGDAESSRSLGQGYHRGWERGIRIGSVRTGIVSAFIPGDDPENDQDLTSGAEGLWVDKGVIYAAEVKERDIVKYVKK